MRQALEYLTVQTDKAAAVVRKDIKWSQIQIVTVNFVFPLVALILGGLVFIVLAVIATLVPLLFIAHQRSRYQQQIASINKLAPPPASWFATSALNQIIKEAQSNLVPNITTIDIRLSLVGEVGASAYQTHSSAILVVTLGLVKLSAKHPDWVRGIVHHEMAHLLHEDTELFDLAMSLSRGLTVYVLCLMGLFAIVYLFNVLQFGWYDPFENAGASGGLLAITLININRIEDARLRSEVLADIRAASVVGPQVMIDTITSCVKPETVEMFGPWASDNYLSLQASSNDRLHPHRDERVFVLRWMADNKMTAQDATCATKVSGVTPGSPAETDGPSTGTTGATPSP
jgi:Zn-dependent protease with chaperone function